MTYSYHHARVSLLFNSYPTFESAKEFLTKFCPDTSEELFPLTPYERILKALQNVPPIKGYFHREFSLEGRPRNGGEPRNYFSTINAKKIDAIRKRISILEAAKQINALETSLLIHDLIMAANDIANIAGTYGHYMSKLSGRACDTIRLTPTQLLILSDKNRHTVLQGYAEEVARSIQCDLCYIDPPYMKRQYAANYHILETLARGDEPDAIGVSGLRPWRDQYSNFCTKTKIRDSFTKIFTEMRCDHFLVSYSEDGLLSLKELEMLFSEFRTVKSIRFANKRFRSNNSELAPKLTEYLIHLRKR
jgi:adenine-specific DNA-methyltransferase